MPGGPGMPIEGRPTPTADETAAFADEMEDDEDELNAWGQRIESTDDYMLKFMVDQLKDTPVDLPKDKNRSKRGKDHRNRPHRVR